MGQINSQSVPAKTGGNIQKTKHLKLLQACRTWNLRKIKLCLNSSNLDITDIFTEIPIHQLAKESFTEQHLRVIQLLVQHGADINAADEHGKTILHYITMCSHCQMSSVYKQFFDLSPDVNIKCKSDGSTPLHLLCQCYIYCVKDSDRRTRILLSRDIDVTQVNHQQETALHDLVKHSYCLKLQHIAECLLEKGLSINAVNSKGQTALYTSHYYSRTVCRVNPMFAWDEFLIIHGANTNIRECIEGHLHIENRMSRLVKVGESNLFRQIGPFGSTNRMSDAFQRIALLSLKAGLDVQKLKPVSRRIIVLEAMISENIQLVLAIAASGARVKVSDEILQSLDNHVTKQYSLLLAEILSLKRLAANVVRTSVWPNALHGVKHLGIPQSLQQFIVLKDF